MDLGAFILRIVFAVTIRKILAVGLVSSGSWRCKYFRVDALLKIRCIGMNLKEIPQYLSTSVEVLDLSLNRIKKIKKSSFQRYKKTKFLLLYENMIQKVEPGALAYLTALEEIDLSSNALVTIPLEIFQLPSLRNLYVDSNDLVNLNQDLVNLKRPIRAPLEYLNVADCGLEDFPNLGAVPNLWHLNISMNPLSDITFTYVATMCHITSIDLMKTQIQDCQCQGVIQYLRYLHVRNNNIPKCSDTLDCPDQFNSTVKSKYFQECKSARSIPAKNAFSIKSSIFLGGVILTILITLYCGRMRQERKNNQEKMEQSTKHFSSAKKDISNLKQIELLEYDIA